MLRMYIRESIGRSEFSDLVNYKSTAGSICELLLAMSGSGVSSLCNRLNSTDIMLKFSTTCMDI